MAFVVVQKSSCGQTQSTHQGKLGAFSMGSVAQDAFFQKYRDIEEFGLQAQVGAKPDHGIQLEGGTFIRHVSVRTGWQEDAGPNSSQGFKLGFVGPDESG